MKQKMFIFFMFLGISTISFADSDPPTNKIPLSKARVIALHKAPGKVRDFEFEIKNHKWVYFFKIAGKDEKWHFLAVDAVTGRIVSKSAAPMPTEAKASVTATPTNTLSPSK